MFQNFESHGSSIHESTNQTVDSLIGFIVKCYHGLEKYTRKKLDEYLKSRKESLKTNNLVNSLNKPDGFKPVSAEIQINGKQVYAKQGEQESINQLTQENLDQLKAAFEHPELVEGSVCILIDNKPVLRIEEGQVLQDDLGLTKSQNQLIEPSLEPENNSERLITQAGSLLITNYGYQVSEDISAFHGHNYCYEQSDESLTIRAYGRGDIFKDGEFTAIATESDRQTLTQLPEKVERQLNQDRQQQQQQHTRTPLRLNLGK